MGLGVSFVGSVLRVRTAPTTSSRGLILCALVQLLQANGIRVLGSTILGLEEHRPEEMAAIIDYAVRHDTVFHQFMLYTPIPGTPLHARHQQEGTLLPEKEFPFADAHGQYRFNYRHPHFSNGEEEGWLQEAFRRDFAANGPSLLRLIRVLLNGWQTHRVHTRRIRDRFAWEAAPLRTTYAGVVWAMRKYYHDTPHHRETADRLLADIYTAFGWKTRLAAPLIGRYIYSRLQQEDARLAAGFLMSPVPSAKKMRRRLPWKRPLPPGAGPTRGSCRPCRNRPGDEEA